MSFFEHNLNLNNKIRECTPNKQERTALFLTYLWFICTGHKQSHGKYAKRNFHISWLVRVVKFFVNLVLNGSNQIHPNLSISVANGRQKPTSPPQIRKWKMLNVQNRTRILSQKESERKYRIIHGICLD